VLRLALVDLLEPVLETVESFPIVNGINKNYASSSLIICLSDSLESLLTGCIPDLHFYFDSFDGDSFDFEVHADGSDMSHLIFFVNVTE
jgi:hypothetical protein